MKLTKVFAALAMVAVATTACQNEPEAINPEQSAKVISVAPAFYSFNRATATAFEEGDQIGLHILTNATYLNNAKYTYTNGQLVAESVNVWYDDEELTSDVLAYYPYNAQGGYSSEGYNFAVQADQSQEGAYAASDLLIAATTSKPTADAVVLPFKHAGSKIVVKVNNESKEAVENVYISNVYAAATFDMKNGTATVGGELTTIKGAPAGQNTWAMIVVPQQNVNPKLIVTTTSGQYAFNIIAATNLVAGKVATANLTISKELISTNFSPEISDWETNDDLEFNPDEDNTPEGGQDPIVPEEPFVAEATDLGVVGSFATSGWVNDAVLYTTPTEGLLVAKGIELIDNDSFKIRTIGVWDKVNVGVGAVNYIQANKYFTASDAEGVGNIFVEAAGSYDIYYNVNTKVVYLMTAGTDIAEATEQTENGKEPVFEEPEVTENILYLNPWQWSSDGAWFAAYFFNAEGNTWVKMTDSDGDGVYEANIPVGYGVGDNVIFCRMDPNKSVVDWSSKWNQTEDLVIGEESLYTITDWGTTDKSVGSWS